MCPQWDLSLGATSGCRTPCRARHENVSHATNRWSRAVGLVVTSSHGLVSDTVTEV